jgi:hypothetical protein
MAHNKRMSPLVSKQAVFIDPSYPDFLEDRLFNSDNLLLNRDNQLLPFIRLKQALEERGIPVHTADRLKSGSVCAEVNHYWSLGLEDYQSLLGREDVRLRGFIILEPSLVAPNLYAALPNFTRDFERVYLHNTIGDGYNLSGVDRSKLNNVLVPQPYSDVVESAWHHLDRLNKIVIVAGVHNPRRRTPELYSARIKAIARLQPLGAIDLYGRGWSRWWTTHAATFTYWRHLSAVRASYQGPVSSKMDTLRNYRFSLCFENMPMIGYVTEKIFDCLYAGTVPVYLGAQNISDLFPTDTYVDMREFGSCDYGAMWSHVSAMSDAEWRRRREAGRDFLRSASGLKYFNSMLDIIDNDLDA